MLRFHELQRLIRFVILAYCGAQCTDVALVGEQTRLTSVQSMCLITSSDTRVVIGEMASEEFSCDHSVRQSSHLGKYELVIRSVFM